MAVWFNFNGDFKVGGTPVITADNRGFRYGDGLFETIKVKDNRIALWDLHADRLFQGIETLGLSLPRHFTKDELEKQILLTTHKNEIGQLGRVRLTVFRGDGGVFDTEDKSGEWLIQAWPIEANQVEYNSKGLTVGVYREGKKSCDLLSSLKSNNYLLSAMAARFAKKQQYHDAILLNAYNRICESSIANIFWVKDSVVFTTPLSEGCVAGVMRKHLMRRVPVREKTITVDELKFADEVFLTNAISSIRWVQTIEEKAFQNRLSEEIYRSII